MRLGLGPFMAAWLGVLAHGGWPMIPSDDEHKARQMHAQLLFGQNRWAIVVHAFRARHERSSMPCECTFWPEIIADPACPLHGPIVDALITAKRTGLSDEELLDLVKGAP
jgi:hypothetical protein